MPKMKTKKAAQRRFKVTANGKVMRMHGMRSHLRRKKAPRTQRAFDKMVPVKTVDKKRLRRLMPYS